MENPMTANLSALFELKQLAENCFQSSNELLGHSRVFGGLVLAQAIAAAQATIPDRSLHSLHAYFLRSGDFSEPITYQVENNRDGGSFSSRRIVASQKNRPICTLAASYKTAENGISMQPALAMPARNPDYGLFCLTHSQHQGKYPLSLFDVQLVPENQRTEADSVQWWLKPKHPVDSHLGTVLLTYISDYGLLAPLLPHYGLKIDKVSPFLDGYIAASLDHAMWIHRPPPTNSWLLYSCKALSIADGRGLAQGGIYDENGVLIASVIQELLMRQEKMD
jgi:acyl-CoA thioesterase-2